MRFMIRPALLQRLAILAALLPVSVAVAKPAKPEKAAARKEASTGGATSGALELGKFADWGAYMAGTGAGKVCFALSQPKERLPAGLARDPAYVFITSRPAQNVRNEVSFMLGFPLKGDGSATIDGKAFALETKANTAFVKNAAEEPRFVDAMKAGAKLMVKTTSLRGHVTTDNYSLSGLGKALEKVVSDCK